MTDHGVGPGSVVAGRFRLEDLLEETGGARFWRATDLTLARNVAVHVLAVDDPRAPAALNAARTSALVSDSHILRVLDAVEQEDVVFLVHEWGSGVSLDQMLTDDVLDGQRAAWLVREVAQAIVAGHTMGVAHGRLIPENVMISEAGAVKLIGFVVNRVLHGRPKTLADGGEPPSEHESDVLNLGALLYACLTGRWPGFPDSVLPPAPLEHGRPLRPRRVKAGVPKVLDTLCEDILATGSREGRDSARTRYESAAAVADALSRYLGDGGGALPVVNAFTELGGPAAFVDPSRAPGPQTPGSLGSFDGDPETGEDPRTPDRDPARDPEATQAAAMVEDSAPGRAVLRSQISDSSAEARAQIDTEERSYDNDDDEDLLEAGDRTAVVGTGQRAGGDTLQRSRVAREALGRRSDRGPHPESMLAAGGATGSLDTVDDDRDADIGDRTPRGTPDDASGERAGAGDTGDPEPDALAGPDVATADPFHTSVNRNPVPWGPDPYGTGSHTPVDEGRGNPGAFALRLAGLLALLVLVVVGVMMAFDLGNTPGPQDPRDQDDGLTRTAQPVEIARVLDLDPPSRGGNGEENPDDTGLTHDGDAATAWRTQTYFDGPKLAPYKQGVGLVVDLGGEEPVSEVELRLDGQGYDVTLLAADPGTEEPPADINGLQRVAREQGTVDDVTFETDVTTQYLVLWFRSLPQVEDGFAGQVAEIVVRS